MPRLVNFMYKGLKNAMSLVLYMRDFLYNDLSLLPIKLFVFFNFISQCDCLSPTSFRFHLSIDTLVFR